MKFACDSCHAQYLIGDEKVGPSGVIVRCKKCQNKIVVRRSAVPPPPPPDASDDEASAAAASAPVPLPSPEGPATFAPPEASPSFAPEPPAAPPAESPVPLPSPEPSATFAPPEPSMPFAPEPPATPPPEASESLAPPEPPVLEPPANGAAALAAAPGTDDESLTNFFPGEFSAHLAEPPRAANGTLEAASFPPPSSQTDAGEFDDELGRAFDSVLVRPGGSEGAEGARNDGEAEQQGFAFSSAGQDVDTDRQTTAVVDLGPMASLTRLGLDDFPEPKNGAGPADLQHGAAEAEVPAATGGAEWFVAINDAQTGPLTLEGVRAHWNKGELSGDSLAWRSGMPDWRPLSSVVELADALAPAPRAPSALEAPAGAFATGAQAAAPSALPPPQDDASETEWKPSAAIALESLVKQELEALQKPPERKPEPAMEAASPTAGGLVGDVPSAAEEPERVSALPSMAPRPSSLSSLPSAAEASDSSEESGLTPVTVPLGVPPPRATPNEPRARAPEPQRRSGLRGAFIGAGIMGVVLLAGGFAVYQFRPWPQPSTASLVPVQPAQVPSATPQAAPVAAAQPVPRATAPAAVPAPVAQPVPAAAQPSQPTAQVAAPPVTPPAEAPAEQPRPPRHASADPEAGSPSAHGERPPKHTKGAGSGTAPVVASAKEPEPVAEAPKPRSTGSNIDDEFNRLFGTGGGSAAAAEAPAKKERPKAAPYIPPAPGTGAASRETLGQGDIMEVVLANKAAIKRCTEASGSNGVLTMRWNIRPDGVTTGVQTVTPEYQKTPLSACLATAIKGFRFPAYSGAPMAPIDFPFKF